MPTHGRDAENPPSPSPAGADGEKDTRRGGDQDPTCPWSEAGRDVLASFTDTHRGPPPPQPVPFANFFD